jgi:hypothetical protein
MPGGAHVKERTDSDTELAAPAPVERTSAGLARRTPRAKGEAARPRPGGDGSPRGATTAGRSPDEVRAMLSRFSSGKAKAASDRDRSIDVDLDAEHPEDL